MEVQILLRRLIEYSLRVVDHSNNWIYISPNTADLDQVLSALLVDLEEYNLLKGTLAFVVTGFGRTPKANLNIVRDHYPQAFTCVLEGGDKKKQGMKSIPYLMLVVCMLCWEIFSYLKSI